MRRLHTKQNILTSVNSAAENVDDTVSQVDNKMNAAISSTLDESEAAVDVRPANSKVNGDAVEGENSTIEVDAPATLEAEKESN